MTSGPASLRPSPPDAERFGGIVGAVVAFLRSPLIRNGYALASSAGITSVLGVVFWIIATRTYTPEEVGVGAALITTMMLIGNISQFNLGSALNRFLPAAGAYSSRIIFRSLLVGATSALIAALALAFIVGHVVEPLEFLTDDPSAAIGFALATTVWTVFALQDSALAGLRRAVHVPLKNVVYSLAKLVLLPLFAGSSLALSGIFTAWSLPLVPMVVITALFIQFRLLPDRPDEPGIMPSRADVLRFLGWDFVGSLAMMATLLIVPLMVLSMAGPAANAVYHLSWTISYSLYLVGRSMSVSLLAELAAAPGRARVLVAEALLHTMLPLALAAVVVIPGAPLIMRMFGPDYAVEGPQVLQLLVLSVLPWSMITLHMAVLRARGNTAAVAVIQTVTLILVIGIGALLIRPYGSVGIALAWVIANTAITVGLIAIALWRGGRAAAVEWSLAMATAVARFAGSMRARVPAVNRDVSGSNRTAIEATGLQLQPVRTLSSDSDCTTTVLATSGDPSNTPRAYLKSASSDEGRSSLLRARATLDEIAGDRRLDGLDFRVPRVLAATGDGAAMIEEAVPGQDGRAAMASPGARAAGTIAAIRAIGEIHRRTSEIAILDEAWLAAWIEHPSATIAEAQPVLLSASRRLTAIATMRDSLLSHFAGRRLSLGRSHGDFSPGNVLFANGDVSRVAALVDWDNARRDAPPGFDACHFLMTLRAITCGDELGTTVRRLIEQPTFDHIEIDALQAAGLSDVLVGHEGGDAVRAMVTLAWLHHVAANLTKSERYRDNRLWRAANIDWVLGSWVGNAIRTREPNEAVSGPASLRRTSDSHR